MVTSIRATSGSLFCLPLWPPRYLAALDLWQRQDLGEAKPGSSEIPEQVPIW